MRYEIKSRGSWTRMKQRVYLEVSAFKRMRERIKAKLQCSSDVWRQEGARAPA